MTVQKNDTNNPIQMQKNKKNEQYGSDMNNRTQTFSLSEDRDREVRAIMSEVYNALTERDIIPSISLWAIFCPKILPISPIIRTREALYAGSSGTSFSIVLSDIIWEFKSVSKC